MRDPLASNLSDLLNDMVENLAPVLQNDVPFVFFGPVWVLSWPSKQRGGFGQTDWMDLQLLSFPVALRLSYRYFARLCTDLPMTISCGRL